MARDDRYLSRRLALRAILYGALFAGCGEVVRDSPPRTYSPPPATSPGRPLVSPSPLATSIPAATSTPAIYQGAIETDSPIVAVSAGTLHSLALRADGEVWGWGRGNRFGRLTDDRVAPVIVDGIEDADIVFAGNGEYSLFIRDGKLIELGFRQTGQSSTFDDIDHVVKVTGSSNYILALRDDGTLWGIGKNTLGELGIGTLDSSDRFTRSKIDEVVDITVDRSEVAAVRNDGTVWRWGDTFLGDERKVLHTPQQASQLALVKSAAFGTWLMALHDDGRVVILQGNTIIPLPDLRNIIQIQGVGGLGNGFALAANGDVWAWGDDWTALGIGPSPEPTLISRQEYFRPKQVAISNVAAISSSGFQVLALDTTGNVWTWPGSGYDDSIELSRQNLPVLIIRTA